MPLGEYIAELGLYDYRNRIYSPDLGRFLQTDPARFGAQDVNLYRYVRNTPSTLRDAFGRQARPIPLPYRPFFRRSEMDLEMLEHMLSEAVERMHEEQEYERNHDGKANPRAAVGYDEANFACMAALFDEPEEDRKCYKCCTVELTYEDGFIFAGDPELSEEDCAGNIYDPNSHYIDIPLNQ